MEDQIDLHLHTVNSDGSQTTSQVLESAQKLNLSVISITDHDSVGAYADLKDPKVRDKFSGRIIPGVELTAIYNGELVEVLGYGIDTDKMNTLISSCVRPFTDTTIDQSKIYMPAFLGYGVKFDSDFVKLITETPEKIFGDMKAYTQSVYLKQMRKHPENAHFFKDIDEFLNISTRNFVRFYLYNPKSTLYADLSPLFLSFNKAIGFIHECGGLAFLAHTYVYSKTIADSLESIVSSYPLDGLECSYTTFTKEQTDYLTEFCKTHNLYMSCGSDFHGVDIKPNNIIGCGTLKQKLNYSIIQPWINKLSL